MPHHMNHIKPFLCPHCGELLDGAVHYANEAIKPIPGAVGVCVWCALPHIFLSDMTTRQFLPSDMKDRDPEELIVLMAMMKKAEADMPKRPKNAVN